MAYIIVNSESKTKTMLLNITNSQSTPMPTGLQVMWQVPVSTLQADFPLLNRNLSNLRFVYNGQFVPAWLESISNGTATIWIKMPVSIPANSSITLNLYFDPSLSFDGVYWGEEPQLSPTYGQYDNGANVFIFYDNFAGTVLNTNKWALNPGGNVIVNNSLFINGLVETTITSVPSFGISVFDFYGYVTKTQRPCVINTFGLSSSAGQNVWGEYGAGAYYIYGYANSTSSAFSNTSAPYNSTNIFSIANDGTNAHYLINYVSQSNIYPMQSITNYIYFPNFASSSGGDGVNIFIQWIRIRAYPPNGVMPTVELM
jgi:hypothetical protein